MEHRSGFLRVYSADRNEVYGEFSDATWEVENTDGGTNHVLSGAASEGTMETFRRLNEDGVDHLTFDFESDGDSFSGEAQLLRPREGREAGQGLIRIETGEMPLRAGATKAQV